jgi:hypothetical protein
VDIGAELFAMSAACVKAKAERDARPEGLELADLFCRQAELRCEELFRGLWDNTDRLDAKAAKRVVEGRYGWLEDGIVPPPAEGPWVAQWEPGPSTVDDVRRRL